MKKKILMGMVALALVSCNNDDDKNNASWGTNLDKVTFNLDDGSRNIMEFDNNKLQRQYNGYNSDGTYDFIDEYTYNDDGQLSEMVQTKNDGTLIFTREIVYDNLKRISEKIEKTYGNVISETTVVFTYYDDNTVFADYTSTFEPAINDLTYYFYETGLLDKITVGDMVQQELQYEGSDITAIGQYTYEYDYETAVKGDYLNIYRNQFNSYSNFVLYSRFIMPQMISNKYMKESLTGGNQTTLYTYEFNDLGYPVEVTATSGADVGTTTILYK